MTSAEKKVAIVTGASSGIGKETVLRLLAGGYDVHAAARRLDPMRALEQKGAHLHHLDLTQPESITGFVEAVLDRSGRVDLLVNAAGYGLFGAVEDVPLSAAREQMEVNLFGLAEMIRAVLPTMRKQRNGRIINVSSIGGKVWSLLGAWYHASKFAVEGLSDCLRNELRPFGIQVVVVEPGGTDTDWAAIANENMKKTSGEGPYRAFVEAIMGLDSRAGKGALAHPGDIADTIWHAASARRPKARYVAPFLGRVMVWLHSALGDRAFDWGQSKLYRVAQAPTPPGP